MKKGIFASVSVVLALGAVVGCSGGNKSPQAAGGDSGDTKTKKTFTMLTESHPSWPYNKDWLIWKLIEEKTGVTLNMQVPSGKLADTVNLNVASGNMPDIMFMLDRGQANKFGQQGALVNILEYTDLMPNFKKWMAQYPDDTRSAIAADGKMYMFPNQGFGETNRMVWLYREDIFKKNNLKVPANYDELYETLKKLKQLYPNTYPFSTRFGMDLALMKNLSANFDTNEGFYVDPKTKAVKYGPIEDGYKKMVEYLAKFYKDGLMPADWLTMDTKQWQDIMSTNKSFVTVDYISRIDFFNASLRKDNPEFTINFMAPPAGSPGGKQVNAFTSYLESGMTVSSTSKSIKDIMKFADFYYSENGRDIASWGQEGVTYTVENGKKKIKSDFIDIADLRKKTGLATNGAYQWIDYDAHLSLASKELQAAYTESRKYDGPYNQKPAFNEKELETISTIGQAIDKNRLENISKFILGTKSMDEWDKYVDGVKKLGLQQLLDTYKTAYDRTSNVSLK
ncbi:hypothetical protein PAESOLCIP111_05023 [Paenibacillus solanacearum]|uniref:Extracellular solute-binding protein n=1 Tax=Paenibacillus solanacearum TaxID=2048548 RepID=A0A916NYI6_9BACL|nr:extracellular solute-binding protein [Paenibacillus solanacearum]CAG7645790.1 hypothetical protein PAESOLCIP111_05023 [Paenibacillus solanacearum]